MEEGEMSAALIGAENITVKSPSDAGEFDGVWVGTGKESNGTVWTIRIAINEGGVQYSVAYPSLDCGSQLVPQSREVNRFKFREQITYGRGACVDQGIMELTYTGKDTLSFSWVYANGMRGASGRLSRSREEGTRSGHEKKRKRTFSYPAEAPPLKD